MVSGCFALICHYGFILVFLTQAYGKLNWNGTTKKVEVDIDEDNVIVATIDNNNNNDDSKYVCSFERRETEKNWQIMHVVCRQRQSGPPKWIGTRYGHASFYNFGYYKNGKREERKQRKTCYWFNCTGKENSLSECPYSLFVLEFPYTPYSYLEGECHTANPEVLKIYVMSEKSGYGDIAGTLLTYVNGNWGPLCTRFQNLSGIACPMFGKDLRERSPNETENKLPFVYDNPVVYVYSCEGPEVNISLCNISTTSDKEIECNSSEFAYIDCEKIYTPSPDRGSKGMSDELLLSILGVIVCLIFCTCAICYKKSVRVRKHVGDDDDDSEFMDYRNDPNITVDEARLRNLRHML